MGPLHEQGITKFAVSGHRYVHVPPRMAMHLHHVCLVQNMTHRQHVLNGCTCHNGGLLLVSVLNTILAQAFVVESPPCLPAQVFIA